MCQCFTAAVSDFIKCLLCSATHVPQKSSKNTECFIDDIFPALLLLVMMMWRKRLTLCRACSLVRCCSGFCSTARLHRCNLMGGRWPGVLRCSGWPGPGPPTTRWPPHSFLLARTEVSQSGPPETSDVRGKQKKFRGQIMTVFPSFYYIPNSFTVLCKIVINRSVYGTIGAAHRRMTTFSPKRTSECHQIRTRLSIQYFIICLF